MNPTATVNFSKSLSNSYLTQLQFHASHCSVYKSHWHARLYN